MRNRRSSWGILTGSGALLAALGALAACGGSSGGPGTTSTTGSGGGATHPTTGTGGTGGAAPGSTFTPKGCQFSIATRAEYQGFAPGSPKVGATPNIRRVRLGLGGNVAVGAPGHADPSTSIAFGWQTDDDTLASEVAWGADPDPAKWAATDRASGVTWLTPQGTIGSTGDERMHEVYVCGLKPATTYYYRVGGGPTGGEAWGDVYSFTTTPSDPATSVRIGVSGDSRGENGDAWHLLQKRMSLASVALQLFSGDMTTFATDQNEWEKWLDQAWKDDTGPLTLPQTLMLSAHGNHEAHSTLFFGNLVQPQDLTKFPDYAELFFSIDVGPVHIVTLDDAWVIDTSGDPKYAPALQAWLEADLDAANKNRANVPWIVTNLHHSAFSSSTHGTDADVLRGRQFFVPIWDKYHVDLAVGGHDHNYERTKPLTGPLDAATKAPVVKTSPADGTVYVVCAGAGAPAYGSSTSPFTELSYAYGDDTATGAVGVYGILSASKTQLKLEAHKLLPDAGGTPGTDPIVDTLTIDKP